MHHPIEQPALNGGVPIKYFLTPEMMPDAATVAQLHGLAAAEGLSGHVAVLPDIHRKGRNISPTGTAVATANTILPRAVDTGICCGIRMLRTDIDIKEFTPRRLDTLFHELMRRVPVLMHDEDVLTTEDVLEILASGCRWSQKRYGLSDAELDHMEDRGSWKPEISEKQEFLSLMPRKAIKKGRRCYGTLGDGNHFLELQEIVEILDTQKARLLGLEKGHAFLMLHTGSRSVGSKTTKSFLKEWEGRQNGAHRPNGSPIRGIAADSEEGIAYVQSLIAASNFGFANRTAITEQLRRALRETFVDASLEVALLYDCAHVSIKNERWRGCHVWIHRHGASRALPASCLQDHPVFSQTGQPVPIPGSMGHDSFVGVAGEQVEESFYSVNHGAGRVMDKPEAAAKFSEEQIEREMSARKIRLYRYGSDNIAEQAPSSFKDISAVIEAMQALSLATPVVRLRPVAVLKG